jgi:hypothetical protein
MAPAFGCKVFKGASLAGINIAMSFNYFITSDEIDDALIRDMRQLQNELSWEAHFAATARAQAERESHNKESRKKIQYERKNTRKCDNRRR